MTFRREIPASLHPQLRQFPQSWNRYAYVNNTPMVATDPTGLDGIKFDPSHIPLMADESWPNGDCTLDGIATSCSWLMPKLSVGDALGCGSLGCGGTVQTPAMTTPLNIEPTVRGWQYVNPYTNEVVTSASELGLPSPGSLGFNDSFQLPGGPQSGGGPESASAAGGSGGTGILSRGAHATAVVAFKVARWYCGANASGRILRSMEIGTAVGAGTGGFGGFVGGEVFGGEFTLGATGVAGGVMGGYIGGTVGAMNGISRGIESALVCNELGFYQ